MRQLMVEEKVRLFSSENHEIKCSMAERLIRTLRERVYRLMTHNRSYEYYRQVGKIVASYNSTIHTTTGMAPNAVGDHNSLEVFNRLRGTWIQNKKKKPLFKVGDKVRMSRLKEDFEKGATSNFTKEIFFIDQVIPFRIPVYQIRDSDGEIIEGRLYEQELSRVI